MADSKRLAISGSYQQYKNDTAVFLTWLLQAARACGYKIPSARENNAESNATTDGFEIEINVAGAQLPLREIVNQARQLCRIADSRCKLPRSILLIARRAIDLRKKVTAHFSAREMLDDETTIGNTKHEFFTKTLEDIVDLLKDLQSSLPPDQRLHKPDPVDVPQEKITNLFALLELEDCDDAEVLLEHILHSDQAKVIARGGVSSHAPKQDYKVVTEDLLMRVNCFFDDLHELKARVVDIWRDVQQGRVDCMEAAMATNAALVICGEMQQDVVKVLIAMMRRQKMPTYFQMMLLGNKPDSYSMITGMALLAKFGERRLAHDPAIAFTAFGRHIFYDIAVILSKARYALDSMDKPGDIPLDELVYGHLKKACQAKQKERPNPWSRVPSLETVFLMFSSDAEKHLGTSDFKQLQKMDNVLTPVLLDSVMRRMHWTRKGFAIDPKDTLSNQIHKRATVWDKTAESAAGLLMDTLPASSMFAWAILWDLHQLIGPELRDINDEFSRRTVEIANSIRIADESSGLRWLEKDRIHPEVVVQLYDVAQDVLDGWKEYQAYAIEAWKQDSRNRRAEADHWQQWVAFLPVSRDQMEWRLQLLIYRTDIYFAYGADSARFLRDNPIAHGVFAYNLALTRHQAGIALANTHLSILFGAYIYAAFRRSNMMSAVWPEMEDVIAMHLSSLFFGSIPTAAQRFLGVFKMRLGLNSGLPRNGRIKGIGGDRTGLQGVSKAKGSCLSISDTAAHMDDWFWDRADTGLRTLYAVRKDMDTAQNKNKSARNRITSSFNAPSFLRNYGAHLMHDAERFRIDYIALTMTCNELLAALAESEVYKPIAERYDSKVWSYDQESNSKGPGLQNESLWRIPFNLLQANVDATTKLEKRKDLTQGGIKTISMATPVASWCEQWLHERGLLSYDSVDMEQEKLEGQSMHMSVAEVADEEFAHGTHDLGVLTGFWERLYNLG